MNSTKNSLRLFLISLAIIATASATYSCLNNATDIIFSEQGTGIVLVAVFMVVVIAIAYAVGSALSHSNYVVFAKDELYHLGFSLLLLIGFSGVVVFSCNTLDFFYSSAFSQMNLGTTSCASMNAEHGIFSVSNCYIDQVRTDTKRITESYIQKHLDEQLQSTFAFSINVPLFNSYTSTAPAYRKIVSNQYDMIANMFLIPALVSINMQKIVLSFISENVIRWILPIAFLLRFFIPTRHIGNILIALSLGLYVIVPFMYAFNLSLYDTAKADCERFADASCDNVFDNYCSPSIVTCSNPDGFWEVARLIPQAFFLPNLTIALLITFLGSIHKALRVIG
ncbi:MAG: hypothetical protein ACP5N9_01425 [Candidatus Bilamarchaeum sp.]